MDKSDSAKSGVTIYSVLSPLLGGLVGFLVGAPLSMSFQPPSSYALFLFFTALGFFTGYRKRNSHAFMYLSIIAALFLILLLYKNAFQAGV